MGADYVQTPNMDALAANGTLFKNGYVPDNHCRPSLQTLMTGTLPIDYDNEVEQLMQKELAKIKFKSEGSKKGWKRNFKHHAMKYFNTPSEIIGRKRIYKFSGWQMVGNLIFNMRLTQGNDHGLGWQRTKKKGG